MKEKKSCNWEKTTVEQCEYRNTHHYCPHKEHACDCGGEVEDLKKEFDIKFIQPNLISDENRCSISKALILERNSQTKNQCEIIWQWIQQNYIEKDKVKGLKKHFNSWKNNHTSDEENAPIEIYLDDFNNSIDELIK